MNKKKRLGRGLEALLNQSEPATASSPEAPHSPAWEPPASPTVLASVAPPAETASTVPTEHDLGLLQLNVHEIEENPFQPRREFSESELASLAESLKDHDILQPILVREVNGKYQLISGERRWRAAIMAGWTTIPARVREADDRLVAELAIVENLQRKDLNAIEKGLSFRRYLDEHGCTQEDLAKRLKIDRSTIANLMRLLELPRPVQDDIQKGELSMGHARALLPLGEAELQLEFANQIKREGLSVRETEQMVSARIQDEDTGVVPFKKPGGPRAKSPQVEALQRQLRLELGTKVTIRSTRTGKGSFVIQFSNHEEFDRLYQMLSGQAVRDTQTG